jgi:hypothetical protein
VNESQSNMGPARAGRLFLAWLAVTVPLVWGVAQTLRKALALFE